MDSLIANEMDSLTAKMVMDSALQYKQMVMDVETLCPYCHTEADVCKASITALSLGKLVRSSYCKNENYDNCALFLAKNLRRR
jgi:aminopeptidase-like protein